MDVLNPYGSNPKGYLSTPGPDRNGEHMMGLDNSSQTTIMAIEFKGGVIIGADTRTELRREQGFRQADHGIGEDLLLQARFFIMIFPTLPFILPSLRSGSAADTQAVADMVAYYLDMHT
eukprot:1326103-Amorphochlora_amoeboformis.AAC.1